MKNINTLKVGDEIFLTGTIYTARDQAHKRLTEAIKNGRRLPFELKEAIIYYCGPTKTPQGKVIGSCGPTTSSRMDKFTPLLLAKGLRGTIGKGIRSQEVRKAIKKYKGAYFITYAGCGALLSKYVESAKIVAYPDLGPEAIYRLEVKDFPLIVAIDSSGNGIYNKQAPK
ncbi:MAG: FumA C-terminus/TtdB family hydratase beta subunit [Candidatus Omnitrophota bacterium]